MDPSLKPPVGGSEFEASDEVIAGDLEFSLKPPVGGEMAKSLKPPVGGSALSEEEG